MPRPCVLDASILLSLGGISSLDLLWQNQRYEWCLSPVVRGEITSEPTRGNLGRAILDGTVRLTELDTTDSIELNAFAEWSRRVDPGEAEAIAICCTRGWVIAIEDRYAQRQLARFAAGVGWINSINVLLDAITDGRVTTAEADARFQRLDCYAGYRKRGVLSLTSLLGS